MNYFEHVKEQIRTQLFVFDLERVHYKAMRGECICSEPERDRFTCPVHHITFPPKGVPNGSEAA